MPLSTRTGRFATRSSAPELPGSPVKEARGSDVPLVYFLDEGQRRISDLGHRRTRFRRRRGHEGRHGRLSRLSSCGTGTRGSTITGTSRSSPQLWSEGVTRPGGRHCDSRWSLPHGIHDDLWRRTADELKNMNSLRSSSVGLGPLSDGRQEVGAGWAARRSPAPRDVGRAGAAAWCDAGARPACGGL